MDQEWVNKATLHSSDSAELGCHIEFWATYYQKDINKFELGQKGSINMLGEFWLVRKDEKR